VPESGSWIVAVDVGGTFTDAVALARDGEIRVAKVPSTSEDPSRGLGDALAELRAAGVDPGDVTLVSHGTTVATNAVLTGRLGHVVLLATQGFRDVLGYRSGSRPDIYSLEPARPSELVRRRDRVEVAERLSAAGDAVVPLRRAEVDRLVAEVARLRPDAVAVALLFSYLDDRHERRLGEALRATLPGVPVTLSAEVAREFREYPRTVTAALNAGLRPVVGRYLLEARARVESAGILSPFLVMQSNGGCVPAERAEREAHRLVLSGPAGGVTGAAALGARHGLDNLISLDMGGTSLDVCLVQGAVPPVVPVQVVDGHPILCSSVDIHTVGAGGGSVAHVDRAGRLHVGPESAGADPGPAAYGRGGKRATVTDAHVAAGTLGRETALAGRLALDEDAAHEAVVRVAEDIGLSPEDATRGILAITMAQITRALRRVSVERGIDPRQFTMVAFGGAGPLHAGMALRELGLESVLLPPRPGLFSAAGLVAADLRIDESRTVLLALEPSAFAEALGWYRETAKRLVAQLREDGVPRARVRMVATADCRYLGQGYELNVPLRSTSATGLRALRRDFDELHRSVYGHASSEEPVELVAVRVSAFGGLDRPGHAEIRRGGVAPVADAKTGERRVLFALQPRRVRVPVYRRELLCAGNRIAGPAIIEQMDTTALVLEGQSARVDTHGNIWMTEGRR